MPPGSVDYPPNKQYKEKLEMDYQKPELTLVGTAEETILGIIGFGSDMDGQNFPLPLEFADDPQSPVK